MSRLASSLLLLLTAAIWGFAFVAQKVAMDTMGAFTFNGLRFGLGAISLVPVLFFMRRTRGKTLVFDGKTLLAGLVAGTILFSGVTLQQFGIIYTTAGKAAFITGMYIVLVPLTGLFLRHTVGLNTWAGVVLAFIGLGLLSLTDELTFQLGDLLQLIGAGFWTAHILVIGRYSRTIDLLKLSLVQFVVCACFSLVLGLIFERFSLQGVVPSLFPLLYTGILSVGVAYTLQAVGQKSLRPAQAAVILSLETVFAALGGWLLLGEEFSVRGLVGCALMLAGMLLPQLGERRTPDSA